jgi:hypothetical protein
MVRAAVSGALDYAQADPTNLHWRLRQKFVLEEIQRQEDVRLLEAVQRQWLAYISHGSLTEESFNNVKQSANNVLDDLKSAIFPWIQRPKLEDKKATIDNSTQKLIDQYKAMQRQWAENTNETKEAKE